jgi:hypothetical protein
VVLSTIASGRHGFVRVVADTMSSFSFSPTTSDLQGYKDSWGSFETEFFEYGIREAL